MLLMHFIDKLFKRGRGSIQIDLKFEEIHRKRTKREYGERERERESVCVCEREREQKKEKKTGLERVFIYKCI